jgi:hypothetical protein
VLLQRPDGAARLRGVAVLTAAVVALYQRIRQLEEKQMADLNDVNAALDANDQAQTDALNRVAEDVAELQRQVAAGTQTADLQPIVDRLAQSTARLQGVDPVPGFPGAGPDQPAA